MSDEAKRRVREQKLGWDIQIREGFPCTVDLQGCAIEADGAAIDAYNALLSTTEQVFALEAMLTRAIDKLWDVKNGLMDIRDSTELSPTKEEWCTEMLAALGKGKVKA